jgi:hypothetical protein
MSDHLLTSGGELQPRGTWTLFAGVVIACFLMMLGLFMMMRVGGMSLVRQEISTESRSALPVRAPLDAPEFILDALVLPALQPDRSPLVWRDPRDAMQCAGSDVKVNRQALRPGTEVPVAPFTLDWYARGCYPFGPDGPRLDGRARLTVYREDWGLSAMVEPAGMRATLGDGRVLHVRRGGAWREATGPAAGTPARRTAIRVE